MPESQGADIEAGGEDLFVGLPAEADTELEAWLRRATGEQVVERIWRRDDTLWGAAGAPEVADRLGWLEAPGASAGQAEEIERFAQECLADGITDVVLLGMGGSSLAPEVVRRALAASGGPARPAPRLQVLDSVDPEAVLAVERSVELERTLFVVSTKSGGTVETLSLARHFLARMDEHLGGDDTGGHFAAITDPGSSLLELAAERRFRRVFLGDPEIGGRFSALSVFGTVPAALAGADLGALLESARDGQRLCGPEVAGAANLGLHLGVALGSLASGGRDKLSVLIDEPLAGFGLWIEQLVAESTGKDGRGIVPVVGQPHGGVERAGPDRVHLAIGAPDGPAATQSRALAEAGQAVLALSAAGPNDLGRLFFVAEFATAVAGWVLGVNPFDQPNVQEAKDRTAAVLARGSGEGVEARPEADALESLLDHLRAPAYLAIMLYAGPTEERDHAADALRAALATRTDAAVTFGYGPRFLHSTGQLHKGGPPTGRFLQLVHGAPAADADIPGADYSFGTLLAAQADGDLEALEAKGRPVGRIVLAGEPADALARLAGSLARTGGSESDAS